MPQVLDEVVDFAESGLFGVLSNLVLPGLFFGFVLKGLDSFADPGQDGGELVVEVGLLALEVAVLLDQGIVLGQGGEQFGNGERVLLQSGLGVENLQLLQFFLPQPQLLQHQRGLLVVLLDFDGVVFQQIQYFHNHLQQVRKVLPLVHLLQRFARDFLVLGADAPPAADEVLDVFGNAGVYELAGPPHEVEELLLLARAPLEYFLDFELNRHSLALLGYLVDVLPDGNGRGRTVAVDDVGELLAGFEGGAGHQVGYLLVHSALLLQHEALLLDEVEVQVLDELLLHFEF